MTSSSGDADCADISTRLPGFFERGEDSAWGPRYVLGHPCQSVPAPDFFEGLEKLKPVDFSRPAKPGPLTCARGKPVRADRILRKFTCRAKPGCAYGCAEQCSFALWTSNEIHVVGGALLDCCAMGHWCESHRGFHEIGATAARAPGIDAFRFESGSRRSLESLQEMIRGCRGFDAAWF